MFPTSASGVVPLCPVSRSSRDGWVVVKSVRVVEEEEDKVSYGAVQVSVGEELGEDFNCEESDEDLEELEDCNETASKRRRRMFHIV